MSAFDYYGWHSQVAVNRFVVFFVPIGDMHQRPLGSPDVVGYLIHFFGLGKFYFDGFLPIGFGYAQPMAGFEEQNTSISFLKSNYPDQLQAINFYRSFF